MKKFLPDIMISEVKKIIEKDGKFTPEFWAEIVYSFAAKWKEMKTNPEKYILLDSLKTLWIGRFVSYAREVKDMDINEAEKIIQRQAEIFEEKFDYLRSIYEDPIVPT